MAVIISAALRREVLGAARAKHADALATLTAMYTAHGKEAFRRSKKVWTSEHDEKIAATVARQLKLN